MEYDIFISYRRDYGTEIARTIKSELEKLGYRVFLDFDELNDGSFEKRIVSAIDSSKIFILILSQNALDPCINETDWVRKEIECAVDRKLHIVPVNPDKKFSNFPNSLPMYIQKHVLGLQISDLMLGQLFQLSLSKIISERITPYLTDRVFETNLQIRPDCACDLFIYDKKITSIDSHELYSIKLKKGKYILKLVAHNKSLSVKEIEYEVSDKTDDFIKIRFDKKHKKYKSYIGLIVCIMAVLCYYFYYQHSHKLWISDDMTTFYINGERFDFIYVQGGNFVMGATDADRAAEPDEYPAHVVHVPDFYIGKFEVTQKQWKAIMHNNPSFYIGDNLPVENINWFDAAEFLRKISLISKKEFTLPTEAQWEYAARGGNQSKNYIYSGNNDPNIIGWYKNNSSYGTHEVGKKEPNELGIYDMSGNVWEWCNDYYGEVYYSQCIDSMSTVGPQGIPRSNWRVFRGGSIQLPKEYMRNTNRDYCEPSGKDHDIGFRIVLKMSAN